MRLTSLFLPPQPMGFYLCRPSASSSLSSAKLNSSFNPFGKGGFASAHLPWAGHTRTGSPRAGREASAQLQKEQASLGSWQQPQPAGKERATTGRADSPWDVCTGRQEQASAQGCSGGLQTR